MFKAYGYSLNRRYVRVIEKSVIYMYLTDDEAKKMEDEKDSSTEAPKKK